MTTNMLYTKIASLPPNLIKEVNDFADFLLSKIEDKITVEGTHKIVPDFKSFDFLKDEEDLYSVNDLKERY